MYVAKQTLPKNIKYLETVSRILLGLFLIGVLYYTVTYGDNYEFYFFDKNITLLILLSPLILGVVFGIISLLMRKKCHLPIKKSVKSFLEFLLIILFFSVFVFIFFCPLCGSTKKAMDSRIMSSITQARKVMNDIYTKRGNYDDFNCGHKDMMLLCQEINKNYDRSKIIVILGKDFRERRREIPVIVHNSSVNSQGVCIYSPLNDKPNYWYCADSRGYEGYTEIYPKSPGYCVEGKSAVCPPLENDAAFQMQQKKITKVSGETSDWKIYRNEEYGFEFRYPYGWEIVNDTLPKTARDTVARGNLQIANNLALEAPKLTLWVNPLGFGMNPSDIRYELTPTEENGVKIITREEVPQSKENLNIDNQIIIFCKPVKLGINTYVFEFTFREGGKDYEPIFKQLLSTFKFLELSTTGSVESECEKWRRECAKEGETPCSVCGCRNCCSGLISRKVTHPWKSKDNEVICLENMVRYICVKCGDGICGKGEDWCICPEDCPKPNPEDLELYSF